MIPCEKVSFVQPSIEVLRILLGLSTVKLPKVNQIVVICEHIIPTAAPFQLAIGMSIASRNAPNNGPEVTEVINIALSITPGSSPTVNATPIIKMEYAAPTDLITLSCCLSVYPLKLGRRDIKSSHVTVANELTFETFKLENKYDEYHGIGNIPL